MGENESQSKVRKLQHGVYQNAKEADDARRELGSWFQDINKQDANLRKQSAAGENSDAFPVRKSESDAFESRNVVDYNGLSANTAPKPARIKSSDYKAWEKFDVDRACDDMEYESIPGKTAENSRTFDKLISSPVSSSPDVTATVKKRAEFEKGVGNQMFESGNYAEAVVHYSRALEYDSENPVYSANRAMANLKLNKFEEAEADCSVALKLDPKYIKAYHRRATARLSLKKLADAKKDFNAVLALDPKNKDAKEKLQVIAKVSSRKPLSENSGLQ